MMANFLFLKIVVVTVISQEFSTFLYDQRYPYHTIAFIYSYISNKEEILYIDKCGSGHCYTIIVVDKELERLGCIRNAG